MAFSPRVQSVRYKHIPHRGRERHSAQIKPRNRFAFDVRPIFPNKNYIHNSRPKVMHAFSKQS